MHIRMLGPLEVSDGDLAVPLPRGRRRLLLAILLARAGETVSGDRLIDALWGESPPATAANSLHNLISGIRRGLGSARVVTDDGGYRLQIGDDAVDRDQFERLAADGAIALAAGRPADAVEALEAGLRLWRGPPFGELGYHPALAAEAARLEEARMAALEDRIDADLARGGHARVLPELDALVLEHPLRERLRGQQMLALYRSGRQAEALAVHRETRERLVAELGIEPGPGLRALHQAILEQDPALGAADALPAPSASPVTPRQCRLPVPPNRTIGRDHDVAAVAERLRSGRVRLLTLTGPGGVGKTRLALETARAVDGEFADGAHFVSLAALSRPEEVPAAIVTNLEIITLSGESPAGAVQRFLATKHLLLVVDNFEHLLPAAPFIGALSAACPRLTVLATSREPLDLAAEQRHAVSPLALPPARTGEDAGTRLASVDAVALFGERARAHDPDFDLGEGNAAVVAEICRRLDGLPLAIELAAARCALLSPREIAARLDASLGGSAVGPRDAPARQRTLRATIDWSHELLNDGEKTCFAAFAAFAGGAGVAAAETVTGADLDTLDRLVAKSLLVRHRHDRAATRLTMLETIRAYAGERLAAGADSDAVGERHYRHYRGLAERHGTERALCGRDRDRHLAELDADVDNLHAALRWAVHRRDAEDALALVTALASYWVIRDRYGDAVHWIDEALALPGADRHPALRARVLFTKRLALFPLGRSAEQPAIVAQLEALAATLGEPVVLSQVLQLRAHEARAATREAAADALADRALHWAHRSGDRWEIARAWYEKVICARTVAQLRERVDRAAAEFDAVGNIHELASLFAIAPYGALSMGSDRDAIELAERAVPIVRAHGTRYQQLMFCGNLGLAALMTGDTERATRAFREELTHCRELVILPLASEGLYGLAALAALRREDERAARLAGAADAHRYGEPADAVDARLRATFLEPARTRLGADAWAAAARHGAALNFGDAIADALDGSRV